MLTTEKLSWTTEEDGVVEGMSEVSEITLLIVEKIPQHFSNIDNIRDVETSWNLIRIVLSN